MRTSYGPARLSVLELQPDEDALTVFRIVHAGANDAQLLDSLRSHYELSQPPRKVERESTVLHMGISVFVDRSSAEGLARRWTKLGDHTARLDLKHGNGFNYADTGSPGHLTLWGDPVKLREAIADIEPVTP
jgi:hypothetical protein